MDGRVEYFGGGAGREERAVARRSLSADMAEFAARKVLDRMADEVDRSLARHLGVPVGEAMAVRDADVIGPALEARARELAAEQRGRSLSARAQLRARWQPGYPDDI